MGTLRRAEPLPWAIAAVAAGAAVGAGAAVDVRLAVALTLALAFATALVGSPVALLFVLMASAQVDAVEVAGVPISRLLAPVAVVVVLVAGPTAAGPRRAPGPLPWAVAFAAWALLSAGWTVSPSSTRFHLLSLAIGLVYMVAFATLVRSEKTLVGCLTAFVAVAVAVGAVAIAAFALGVSSLLQDGRANGGAGDPNFFAMYQVMAIPMALALAAGRPPGQRRLLLVGVAVLVASVFASVSRGGLLSLLAVTALMLLVRARALFASRREKRAVLTALAAAAVAALLFAGQAVTQRVESLEVAGDTGSGRTALWSAARTAIDERPILGLGYGAFSGTSNDLLRRTPGVDFRHLELRPGTGSEVHNVYLSVLAELGLPGLVLLVGLIGATARELGRVAARARRSGAEVIARAAGALLLAMAAWAVASIFLTTDTSRVLWIIIGTSMALPRLVGAPAAVRGARTT